MLDNLVESKSNAKENKTRGGFLLTTFVLVVTFCFSAVLWSLFAKDLETGGGNLDISTLVAPIQVTENAPPELLPKQEKREQKSDLPTRQTNMMQVEESQIAPEKVSVVPNTQRARPAGEFLVSDTPESGGTQGSSSSNFSRENGGGKGIQVTEEESSPVEEPKKIVPPPPAIKKTPVAATPKIKSGGVVNGEAKLLPKPVYSAAAKAVKANGTVNVQVLIDEAGNVVSANALDGHSLLKGDAERAARSAKFKPTLLSGQPVKVSGIIVYRFSLQ